MKKFILGILFVLSTIVALAATGEGVGEGHKDDIKVSVDVKDGKITNIQILEMSETRRIAEPAIRKLTQEILEKQTTEVDNVAGATYTSLGFKQAVKEAIKNAK